MEETGGKNASPASAASQWTHEAWKVYQYYLDKSIPFVIHRWIATVLVFWIFFLRVYLLEGFYIIAYGVGIYILNLLIAFLSPLVDPETEPPDGPVLPTRGSDEFKPFIRRLPEFKFWHSFTKAFGIGLFWTFFSVFDVPVFWPILLFYWIILFLMTMKRQIAHMIKYKYIPFTIGKQRYGGKKSYASSSASPSDK
ncbi:unnamed protein product [Rhodiola kirilowii]